MTATTEGRPAPSHVADVALIDAAKCAGIGDMSVSWWHDEVRAGRAPAPVIRKPRCTRWRFADVLLFWQRFAEQGAADTQAATAVVDRAARASKAANKPEVRAKGAATRKANAATRAEASKGAA